MNVLVAGLANGTRECFARDTGDGRFAGGIDINERKNIGLIESAAEIGPEVLGAAETMRLKEHQEAIELAATGCFERGANLGGVMAVVVNHGDVVDHSLDVKAAADAGKLNETFANQVGWNIQVKRDRGSRSGVANIVHAGRMRQPEDAEVFALVGQAKLAAQAFEFYIADDQVGLARSSISNDGALYARNDGLHVGFINTEDCGAIEGHA